jgi:glycosyltransferase involved in cell wall biosynthesis
VLLEAMSAGLATLSTALPAVSELIQDGVNGLILPDDPGAAARVLASVISDPELRGRLGRNARETVLAGFSQRDQIASLADRFHRSVGRLT